MGSVLSMPRPAPLDRSFELDATAPVPLDRPFTTQQAHVLGVSRTQLDAWVSGGALLHPIRGVFHARHLVDTIDLRLSILRLVVPEDCVVTDRTAAWVWGAPMALAPGDHLVVPPVQVFCPPGRRLRNDLVASGERRLGRGDVAELDGLRVTTALRTACDLGRLLHRDSALAAMDSLASLGYFAVPQLIYEVGRFRRYRGVRQLREMSVLVDPASQSFGESVLRLRWTDVGLPRPTCQVPVLSPYGSLWWIDLGLPGEKFGAEYDGELHHGPEHAARDAQRRGWMRDEGEWRLVIARQANVFGRGQDIEQILVREARLHGLLP